MATSDDEFDDDFEVDLDLLGILRRRYHLIALGVFLGAVFACLYFAKQVPIYESNLAVLVGHRSADLNSASAGSLVEGATTIEDVILSTHIELFRSPKVIERAISNARLDRSVGEVRGSLSVGKGGSGNAASANLLTASYRDEDPEAAAKILQAVYESYFSYVDDQSRSIGAEAADLIANAQLKNEETLRQADRAYREFLMAMPTLVSTNQDGDASLRNVHQERLEQIESELNTLRRDLKSFRSRRDMIEAFVGGRQPEEITDAEVMLVLSDEEISRLHEVLSISTDEEEFQAQDDSLMRYLTQQATQLEYSKMLELSSRLSFLKSTLGNGHPSVREIESQIASLKEYVAKQQAEVERRRLSAPEEITESSISPVELLRHYFNVLQSDIKEFEQREEELLLAAETESKDAKDLQMKFMEGNSLKSNLDRAQARYDQVFQRLQEINLTNDYAGFSTDLLVTPSPAMFPVWPAKTKIAGMGLVGGLMLGAAFAMLAEFVDRTFKNPQEVEAAVGAPILSHLPLLQPAKLKQKVRPDSAVSPMLVAFHAPRSSESETFRVLRTSILFRCKSESKQLFMLTSPSPADGKSTMIANLAVSMAQTGKRVLLVDGDMRRPTVTKTFGLETRLGLSDYLKQNADLESVCQSSEQANLTICSEGTRTSQPSELLESDRFQCFVDDARSNFDIIFIDTPPLLAVADPAIISEHVDGCLMAVRVAKNNRTIVARAAEILAEHGKKAMGVIINTQSVRSRQYGYSSYNYYGKKENGYVASYRRYYAASDVADEEASSSAARISAARLAGLANGTSPANAIEGRMNGTHSEAGSNGHHINGHYNGDGSLVIASSSRTKSSQLESPTDSNESTKPETDDV